MSSHVERELFERLLEQIRELWSGTPLQALESALLMLPPEMQEPVRIFINKMGEAVPRMLADAELNIENKNKREVYLAVADFLASKLGARLSTCLAVIHKLAQESDNLILQDGEDLVTDPHKYFERAKKILALVKVTFEFQADKRQYKRRIEIWHRGDDEMPRVRKVETTLPWDETPQSVRGSKMLNGENLVSFTLYPIER